MIDRSTCAAIGLVLVPMLAAGRAEANDAVASVAAGGIELLTTEEIAMVSEDLYVSLEEIRVRYEFRNLTQRDIETTVAFPLPPVEMLDAFWMGNSGAFDLGYDYVGFRVEVDGQAVTPELLVAATMDGRDIRDLLDRHGLPYSVYHPDFFDRWDALSPKAAAALAGEGVIASHDGGSYIEPLWRFEAAYHWEQRFPAGATVVVAHTYAPVVGATFVDHSSESAGDFWFSEEYCVDAATDAGIRRRFAEMPAGDGGYQAAYIWWVDYILTTANSWAGPIGRFRLTVDKGDPRNIVSWCGEGVRKTGPTTFVVEREDYEPTEELHIMVLEFPQ